MLASATRRVYEQAVILNVVFGFFACLSFALLLWQWLAARKFPLHRRVAEKTFAPGVTLLKPLKGCDAETENCLRSWFTQEYAGAIQILFAVASADDPVCKIVHQLAGEFAGADAQLVVCENLTGTNAKVSKLAQLVKLARHEVLVVSDADVRVPKDFLANAIAPLNDPRTGLVNCFYRLANPTTLAMQWEAIAINADFWSQVLQSKMLKPLDFALGAVMITRRKFIDEIGGFEALENCLADDYQLGHRISKCGHRIKLCPVVVECWHSPQGWREVWKHQLRWARTIRVCQPAPYFFSILSNATLWPLLWFFVATRVADTASTSVTVAHASFSIGMIAAIFFLIVRVIAASDLMRRLNASSSQANSVWLAPIKDLLQAAIWFCAFAGNTIEWRGRKFVLNADGTLRKK